MAKTNKDGYATKSDVSSLGHRLDKKLDDIIKMLDKVFGELKIVREEQTLLSSQHGRVLDLEDKVESLEKIHPGSQHVQL